LNSASKVHLTVYDITRKLADVIMNGEFRSAGTYYLVNNQAILQAVFISFKLKRAIILKLKKLFI
jgi:hypothetical protein